MHLTLHSDYSLRLLMLLAVEADRAHTVEEVAGRYDISRNHLNKVVQTLVQAKFIRSVRGRGGGISLALPPEEINLGDVIRASEDNFDLVECFDKETNTCILAPVCGLKGPLEEALMAFLKVLDSYSLHDLVMRPGAYRKIRKVLSSGW